MLAVAGLAAGYGVMMTVAASAAYWGRAMRRGAFATMTLGGVLLIAGAVLYAGGSRTGIGVSAAALYVISDAAYAVGTQRADGPRLSHHVLRAALAGLLIVLMVAVK